MRLIATIPSKEKALGFSLFLSSQGIENQYELSYEADFHPAYAIWVIKEEEFDEALKHYQEFLASPDDPKYKEVKTAKVETPLFVQTPRRRSFSLLSSLTHWILMLCVFLFLWDGREEKEEKEKGGTFLVDYGFSPLEQKLLYDYPSAAQQIEILAEKHRIDSLDQLKKEPAAIQQEFERALSLPMWKGILPLFLEKTRQGVLSSTGPLFEKIRGGEIWRFFSPSFLHRDFWHIFFNMGWLLILGKQIEVRLKRPRMLLLILLLAAISNTAQYLVSGPYFLGFSGVIAGLAGFIWSRQKKAPWEGYPFHRTTAFFLFYLILIMFVVGVVCFLLQLFSFTDFSSPIANTAHISGGLAGYFLGRFSFFARRLT
jgi:GlpG protein